MAPAAPEEHDDSSEGSARTQLLKAVVTESYQCVTHPSWASYEFEQPRMVCKF